METNTNNCKSGYKIEDIQGIIGTLYDNSVSEKIDDICYHLRKLVESIERDKNNRAPQHKVLIGIGAVLDGIQEDVREATMIAGGNDAVQRATDMLAVMTRKETPNIRMES